MPHYRIGFLLTGGVAGLTLLGACGSDVRGVQESRLQELSTRIARLEADTTHIGRFQIVNGTPGMARNIMRLDTHTGRTWLLCETKDPNTPTSSNWCAMETFGDARSP